MLPYFFQHYDPIVDRYFISDHGSTDRSRALLAANRKVVLREFKSDSDSFVWAANAHYNQCWKQSRGVADWVIIVNVDEHIYHSDLRRYLEACTENGVSILRPEGYNMVSDDWPPSDKPLWQTVQHGMRDPFWDKPQVFDPNRIEEINFKEGRHTAAPAGEVVFAEPEEARMLHYKYLGAEYMVQRHAELRARIPTADFERGFGYQYLWDEQKNIDELQRARAAAVRVVQPENSADGNDRRRPSRASEEGDQPARVPDGGAARGR
jgi:hypothetical protein